jgi:hypothetical protein
MKGMWNVLERAGLVRQEDEEPAAAGPTPAASGAGEPISIEILPPAIPVEALGALPLEQVYQAASVPPAPYPAERLLRLLDGLKAMDEVTRRQAIQAMDAADDSWSIDDPIRDAAAKVAALDAHAGAMRRALAQSEQDTRAEMDRLLKQHEGAVADIKRQIADLEALLSREIARATQEGAAMTAALQSQVESTGRELGTLSRIAGDFRSLIAQFSSPKTH